MNQYVAEICHCPQGLKHLKTLPMKSNILAVFLAFSASAHAATIGQWSFDDDGAASGGEITAAANVADPGNLDAAASGGAPVYSDDVPAGEIFDPVSGNTYTNGFSFDASGGGAQLLTPDAEAFDSSFTIEFFIKMTGEPRSYESVLRREEVADLRWQIDFDHSVNPAFGRLRTRWDTQGAAGTAGVGEVDLDENFNFVLGSPGNASGAKVYIDTGAKDEFGADIGPQNTGDAQDYIYDAASANPNELDVALQGDGINDVDEWHHVAISFDQTTGEINYYFDYRRLQTRTLADTEADGYTHPAAGLSIGKHAATANGMLIDEVRFSNEILTAGSFLREPIIGSGNTIAHWRMEGDEASDGAAITAVENSVSPLHAATRAAGTPTYSIDVPGPMIFDPITDTTYTNNFSLDATTANSRLGTPDDAALNTSFTVEMFIKTVDQPAGYNSFVRRRQENDLRWQIDFDHGNASAFGRIRTRFDTPLGEPDGMPAGDENTNFVLGAQGGASVPGSQRLYVDTDLGDGLPGSYDDAVDWALDGDDINDITTWHHVAVTFDQDSGELSFYYDHELMQIRTLSDSAGDGYTHPAGALQFGKFAVQEYGLLFDELRYSGEVLLPAQFLQAQDIPEPGLEILDYSYDVDTNQATFVWRSVPGNKYGIDRSSDLKNWFELIEDDVYPDATSSYTDTQLPAGTPQIYYRVRDVE